MTFLSLVALCHLFVVPLVYGLTATIFPQPKQAFGKDISVRMSETFPASTLEVRYWYLGVSQSDSQAIASVDIKNNSLSCTCILASTPPCITCSMNQDASWTLLIKNNQLDLKLLYLTSINNNSFYQLNISYCSPDIIPPHGPSVTALSANPAGFGATGSFQCSSGTLYNSSTKAKVANSSTTCLADATWDGGSTAECWSAPNATLKGPTDLKENIPTDYNCTLSGGYPMATGTIFYLDGTKYNESNKFSTPVALTFTKEANGKNLTCQALTEFTKQNASSGISSVLTLNVAYPPRNVSATVHTSGIKSGSIYLFHSNKNVTIKCSSDGNPDPSCSWNTSVVSDYCETSGMFNSSANLTCTASNSAGNNGSNTIQIISVNAQRKAQISVNSAPFANSQKANLSEGQQVTLECKVENSDKLNTTFSWNKNGVHFNTSSSLVLSNVSWDSGANYTCNTNDSFGSLDATITVDVQYPPRNVELVVNPEPLVHANGSIYFKKAALYTFRCNFTSNPAADCLWSVRVGQTNKTIRNGSCQIERNFTANETIQCVASNFLGNRTVVYKLVVVGDRQANVSLSTGTNPITAGLDVNISCNVKYSDVFKTSFSWQTPNSTRNLQKSKYFVPLQNVTEQDSGSYQCFASDTLGNFSSSVGIDVLFSPTTITPTQKCELTANPCEIFFNSNPEPTNATLTGPSVAAPGKNVFVNITPYNAGSPSEYIFTYKFTSIGDYQLKVVNSIGSGTIQIPVTKVASNIGIIIGASVAGVVVIVLIVLLVVCKRRKSSKDDSSEKEERQNPLYVTSGGVGENGGAEYATVDTSKKKKKKAGDEKVDRVNPLYAASSAHADSIEDAYASVDKGKHTQSEKEDRVNPLYASSGPNPANADETYAQVDKKAKKNKGKGEKEMKVNVLYGASGNGNQLEDAYASVDKSKKAKGNKDEKEERLNPLYGGVNDGAGSSGDTYSTVNKPNKKNKKGKKHVENDQDGDPYAAVGLHGQTSK